MKLILHRQTLEYVTFTISTAPIPANVLDHQVAIVPATDQPSGWVNATYSRRKVRVLVRASTEAEPGGQITLGVGLWRVWWRASADPEWPVRRVGTIQVV